MPDRDAIVLVVDDDPDLLLLCATHLRSAGYAVLMAQGSAEAQAACEVYPTRIDPILLDALLYPPESCHVHPKSTACRRTSRGTG